jgi:hypothetical protein
MRAASGAFTICLSRVRVSVVMVVRVLNGQCSIRISACRAGAGRMASHAFPDSPGILQVYSENAIPHAGHDRDGRAFAQQAESEVSDLLAWRTRLKNQ